MDELYTVQGGGKNYDADIIIHSGEGEVGTYERYYGERSKKALRARLSRERCHGDRWAHAWMADGTTERDPAAGVSQWPTYWKLGDDLEQTSEARSINPASILKNPAAMLRAGKPNPKSAENGAKGGRPRKQ